MAHLWLKQGSASAIQKMPEIESRRITAHGKFLSQFDRKFFFKAIRVQNLADRPDLSTRVAIRTRFERLRKSHATGLVLDEAAADVAVDLAAQAGLSTMVEIRIAPHVLLDRAKLRAELSRVERSVRGLTDRDGLVGYLVDCALNESFLRAHGPERIRKHLRALIASIRDAARGSMLAIKHRPMTRGCSLLEEDFIYCTVPPLSPADLKEYVIGLHNLAESRPIILEFERATADQEDLIACAFGLGAAGVVAPITPSPLRADLTLKMLSADELMPFLALNGCCPPKHASTPMVSVVICAYNAERTMRACLESLRQLDYPNYEVVIVDDGSRDRTAEISMEFPEFRLIRQPNRGLSAARNVGMHAARGDLIAYADSDCVADPHWLAFMVRAIVEGGFDGCGGPNYAPHEDGRIEGCVAASPGAPCHVLTGADRAEHLAGCNMVLRRSALLAVGGFDPQFTSAGDDVDICWRMLDSGYQLGFCPSAFVWHFRRNSLNAYYGQQRGYGRAEAMLYRKYPHRFNALGQIKWQGTIPGLARTLPGGSARRILWAVSRPGLQTVYEPVLGLGNFLPQTLEWNLIGAALLLAAVLGGFTVIPGIVMLALGCAWAAHYAIAAPIERCHSGFVSRLLVGWLAYSGPMVRAASRYRLRLRSAISSPDFTGRAVRQRPQLDVPRRSLRLTYWNEKYTTRDRLLQKLQRLFARAGYPAIADCGWNDFDLEVRPGPLTRIQIKTAEEEHGGTRLKTLALARVRMSWLSRLALLAGVLVTAAATVMALDAVAFVAGMLTIGAGAIAVSEACDALRRAYQAIEQCAEELEMLPLGEKTSAARREAAAESLVPERRPVPSAEFLNDASMID